MKFEYHGVDMSTSQVIQGEIEAVSEGDAMRTLKERRVEVFSLTAPKSQSLKGRRVKESDLVMPIQELATLTSSGVSLIDATRALAQNKEHPKLAQGFKAITSRIEGGESLSEAMGESDLPFPEYVPHLVKAGELTGRLDVALTNAAEQMSYEESVKSDVRSALTYPLVLIGGGIVAMLIIFFAVVPKFSHMLDEGKELPTLAYVVLSAGKMANENPQWVGLVVLALVGLVAGLIANKQFRKVAMEFALSLPVIGPWLAEQDAARWSALSAAMLSSRVDLIAALKLAAHSSGYRTRTQRGLAMIADIESGSTFTDAMERARLVPPTSLNLIAVGDKTGQLAEMLHAVSKLHDAACKRRMKQVLTLLEPIAILIVGVMIGIMILGIVLAITASTDIAI
ncbi:type II secretion system F family protein [Aestuariibacter salexigens]|uniref:type II secretion system F family protein n=1 Tax=Aestuariibacter salexigens TaxID=226010 RepID=UPI0003FF3BF5|nr:type II secretion system F family protein [Aestuariibacter salexigens]